jgi:single-strand DNA-binding protein
MNFNKAMLGGRLTADPELRQTTSGISVCSFSIAVNRIGKDEEADFFECTAFKERAELVARCFRKGSNIFVCGRLRQERFTDKQGNNRSKVTVSVDEVCFVDKKEAAPDYAAAPTAQSASAPFTPPIGKVENGVYNPYAKGGSQTSFAEVSAQDDADLPF